MRTASFALLVALALPGAAQDWQTVGGNSMRTGLSPWSGPRHRVLAWEAVTLPAIIPLQAFTGDSFCVTGRYTFNPNKIDVVCHSLVTGETLWTRNWSGTGKYLPFGLRDGRIYIRNFKETQHDTLLCADLATGDILWVSPQRVDLGIVWSAAFTDDGDLLVPGDSHRILRINHLDGELVWACRRVIPSTGGECIGVWGDRAFSFKGALNTPKRIIAIDLATGAIIDSSDILPGDGDQEVPFTVGPGGVVYAPRDGGELHALQYTDAGFVEKWRVPYGGSVWMQFAVDADSSILIPRGSRLYRLDHRTGAALDSSPPLTTDQSPITPRVSVDRHGYSYLTTGTYQHGGIWCLSPELDSVWFDPVATCYYTGPAMSLWGTVVPLAGSTIRCYAHPLGIATPAALAARVRLTAGPSPFRSATRVRLAEPGMVTVYDALGREVTRFAAGSAGTAWDGRDRHGAHLPAGAYLLRAGGEQLRLVKTTGE